MDGFAEDPLEKPRLEFANPREAPKDPSGAAPGRTK